MPVMVRVGRNGVLDHSSSASPEFRMSEVLLPESVFSFGVHEPTLRVEFERVVTSRLSQFGARRLAFKFLRKRLLAWGFLA